MFYLCNIGTLLYNIATFSLGMSIMWMQKILSKDRLLRLRDISPLLLVLVLIGAYATRCSIRIPIERASALEIVTKARAEYPQITDYFKEYDQCVDWPIDRKLARVECRYKARLKVKDEKSLAQMVAYDALLDQRLEAADLSGGLENHDHVSRY